MSRIAFLDLLLVDLYKVLACTTDSADRHDLMADIQEAQDELRELRKEKKTLIRDATIPEL